MAPRQALQTDFYELTMAAGYFAAGKTNDGATFELFVRQLPPHRKYIVAAGLAQAVDYLLNLRFTGEELDYLRGLPQLANAAPEFFDYLANLRFTGDLFAVPEGTPLFPSEPFLTIRGNLIEAQLAETFLLSTIGFQSMIATKASRVARAAMGRSVVEFGTRRAHSPEAGVLAGRAAYIGGCIGTSNTESGFRYGVPIFGTAAHSWVMSFAEEREAFAKLQRLLGERCIYLIDTYDTLEGARRAAALGKPLWGVRLDSGNLGELAPAVRKILDDAGLHDAKIMATNDLNEYKIQELIAAQAPIDVFGVGTELATSFDAPSLGVVYKLVEIHLENDDGGQHLYPSKLSPGKHTLPGAKQIFRHANHDVLGLANECVGSGIALQRRVIVRGQLVEPLPSLAESREHAARSLAELPSAILSLFEGKETWPIRLSPALTELDQKVSHDRLL